MKRMINKELVPVLKDKEIDYWLLTYVKDRLYYEFSGNGGEDIPWDKIEAELKDKVEDPLEYITGKEDDVLSVFPRQPESKRSIPAIISAAIFLSVFIFTLLSVIV